MSTFLIRSATSQSSSYPKQKKKKTFSFINLPLFRIGIHPVLQEILITLFTAVTCISSVCSCNKLSFLFSLFSTPFFSAQYLQIFKEFVLIFLFLSLQSYILVWHDEGSNLYLEYVQYICLLYSGYCLEASSVPPGKSN